MKCQKAKKRNPIMCTYTDAEKKMNWNNNHERYQLGGENAKLAFRGGWCWAYAHQFSTIKGIPAFWISPTLNSSYLSTHAYCVGGSKYFDCRYPSGIASTTFFGSNKKTGETAWLWNNGNTDNLPIGKEINEIELREQFSQTFPTECWETTLEIANKYIRSTIQ